MVLFFGFRLLRFTKEKVMHISLEDAELSRCEWLSPTQCNLYFAAVQTIEDGVHAGAACWQAITVRAQGVTVIEMPGHRLSCGRLRQGRIWVDGQRQTRLCVPGAWQGVIRMEWLWEPDELWHWTCDAFQVQCAGSKVVPAYQC